MGKITYDNKIQLNENANIPNNQKCRAVDMNEIKNIVNGNDDEFIQYKSNIATGETYSTDEVKTNKIWIDGKPIYRKVVNMGNLVNNSSKNVAHNLSNFVIRTINGSATNGSVHIGISGFNDEVYIDKTNVIWNTKANRSSFTAYVVLEYTKQ